MKTFSLPYGKTNLTVQIPECFETDLLIPNPSQVLLDPEEAIRTSLSNPLGKLKLTSFSTDATIAIAINDKTRPVPKPNPIPYLLNHLQGLGFEKEKITLYIGSGTHTPMRRDELSLLLDKAILADYRVIVHDCDQTPMIDLGETAHHTPIRMNADFVNSEIKISVGNIEPHHFMGFSGGVKTAAIGLASRETIDVNHAMLKHPQAKTGVYHINPMRQDLEEMGQKANIHFSFGTILNEDKKIVNVYFGNPVEVMNAAIPEIRNIFGVSVPHQYDLVIASPGGAPKDINLYQAQKGLTHAARITKNGGWVILLAACTEGSGSSTYEDFVTKAQSHQAIIDQFNEGFFRVGPHKAFQIARDTVRVKIILVSDLPPQDVKRWKLTPSKPELLQPLIDWIANRLPENARVAILPASTRTMTEVK